MSSLNERRADLIDQIREKDDRVIVTDKSEKELRDILESVKTLWNLKLHEGMTLVCGMWVMKVPSGWIYDCWDFHNDQSKPGTFVPYQTEKDMNHEIL